MMTVQHILYIPTIFLLGLVLGTIINQRGKTFNSNEQLQYRTTGKRLLPTFLIFVLVFLITHIYEIPWGLKGVNRLLGGLEIFDRQPVFSGAEVYERIRLFPEDGLLAYKRFTYTIDVLFPVTFFVFLLTFARFVSERIVVSKYLQSALISLPIAWLILDLIENAIIFTVLSGFPAKYPFLSSSLGLITLIKFSLLFLSLIIPSLLILFAKKALADLKHKCD